MSDNSKLLFILGGMKTATTSMCGLLNHHPDVLVMCEVMLNSNCPGRWGRRLLKGFPDVLPFFFGDRGAPYLANYRQAQTFFAGKGHGQSYFGDKFATIDSGYAEQMEDARVIFCVRSLPEWVAKDSVRAHYPLDANIAPFAVQYCKHFLESFLLENVYHVRMVEFLKENAKVVDDIWRFLGLTPPKNAYEWWQSIGHYGPDDPKGLMNWWKGHMSSATAPKENDTSAEIAPHPFWDAVLPIFERYYALAGSGSRAELSVVLQDIAALEKISRQFVVPIETAYKSLSSRSRNFEMKEQREKKTAGGGVMRLLGLRRRAQ